MNEQELREQIGVAVESRFAGYNGRFTAASVEIRWNNEMLYSGAFGEIAPGEPVLPSTLFDLDTLTELFTATAFLRLVDAGRLWIDTPVSVVLGDGEDESITFYHLLTHSSGLQSLNLCDDEEYDARLAAAESAKPPAGTTPGAQVVYSALDFIQLGLAVEALAQLPLEQAIALLVLQPLDSGAEYAPLSSRAAVAPILSAVDREAVDANVRCLDGVAGHAGLFGRAEDVANLAQMYLDGGLYRYNRLLSEAVTAEATRAHLLDSGLGWHIVGETWRKASGTGCSVVVDAPRHLIMVILTNTDPKAGRDSAALEEKLLIDLQTLIDQTAV